MTGYVYRGNDRDVTPTPASPARKASKTKAGHIPLDRIQFHNHNVRRNLGDLRVLAQQIAEHGVITPVVLEVRGEMFRIRDGHRRVAAARIAGLTTVPAFVHGEALKDRDWVVNSLQANHHRSQLQREERRLVIDRLRAEGMTWAEVAHEFGVTAVTVQRWAKPPEETSAARRKRSGGAPALLAAERQWLVALLEENQLRTTGGVLAGLDLIQNGAPRP